MILIISASFLGVIVILLQIVYSINKKKYNHENYLTNLKDAKAFLRIFEYYNDYMTWVERDNLKLKYAKTGQFFRNKTRYYNKETIVKKFNDTFIDFDYFIECYNANYIKREKERLSTYFDNIDGKKLDDQQRTALLTDEYSNLIVAGAGSGKTLTILGKVKYLIEQKKIAPDNILLISFTRKTVEELNERLKKNGLPIEAVTFHKLGYEIIKMYHSEIPAVTNENTLTRVIKEYLEKDIFNDAHALTAYLQFIACFMSVPEDSGSYDSLGEKLDTEKGIDFQTIKGKYGPLNKIDKSNLDTVQGERVKSVEELAIANFLFLNGVEYEYENAYPYGDTMYRPDFYIKDYDIYLEHFGVDENNNANWLTPLNAKKYVDGMMYKRELHRKYNTRLIETYSFYNRDKVLLQKLANLLESEGVTLRPRDPKDVLLTVTQNNSRFGQEINKLVESFINLSKSKRLSPSELKNTLSKIGKGDNDFMYERQNMFLKFVLPILKKYNLTLDDRTEIDYNDMINRATDVVKEFRPNFPYQYIMIDEYQDISHSRFNLIKGIRERSGARLICVGDDWQSIYRFAGSDISLFTNFSKYVGKCERLLIEQTYRNSQSLTDISAHFIQKNRKQLAKRPISKKDIVAPIKLVRFEEAKIVETFLQEIRRLVKDNDQQSILVLGRHSFDIHELIKPNSINTITYNEKNNKLIIKGAEHIDIQFLTVHKSKGTEADNVIILNLKNHLLGFPNKISDDPILSLLLGDAEDYRFAEERRLFYVALTRTKKEVVILVPEEISLFAEELILDNDDLVLTGNGIENTTRCPYCKTGKLVIRQTQKNGNRFLGCTNFPNCRQTFSGIDILENTKLCPECKSGFMKARKSKYGAFLGCTNYPKCKKTIKLNP